eukprot:747013-Hanusia_phi.AAC.1
MISRHCLAVLRPGDSGNPRHSVRVNQLGSPRSGRSGHHPAPVTQHAVTVTESGSAGPKFKGAAKCGQLELGPPRKLNGVPLAHLAPPPGRAGALQDSAARNSVRSSGPGTVTERPCPGPRAAAT